MRDTCIKYTKIYNAIMSINVTEETMAEVLGIHLGKIEVLVCLYRQDARRLVMDLCNIDEPRIRSEIARSIKENTPANIATTLTKLCELGVLKVLQETKIRSKRSMSKQPTQVINKYSMMPEWREFFCNTASFTMLIDGTDSQSTDDTDVLNMTHFGRLGYLLHINTSPLLRNCLADLLADTPLYYSEILDPMNSYLPSSQRADSKDKQRTWLESQIKKAEGIVDEDIYSRYPDDPYITLNETFRAWLL